MRKLSVFITGTLLGGLVVAQSTKVKSYNQSQNIAKYSPYEKALSEDKSSNFMNGPITQDQFMNNHANKTSAINVVQLGMSGNAYTNVTSEVNLLSTVPGQNWVTFIHRHNQQDFGGHNGQMRVDVSDDGGQTWVLDNDGNDAFNPNVAPYGRIPQATIYNPTGNTDICNAKLIWVAAGHKTPNPSNTGPNAAWGHFVHGTAHEIYPNCTDPYNGSYNSWQTGEFLYTTGLSKSAPDQYWSIGVKFNRDAQQVQDKLYLMRGDYIPANNAAAWYIYDSLTFNPLQSTSNGQPAGYQIGTPNMAFSPNGQYGWIIVSGMPNQPAPYKHQLYYWKSNDFGLTWTPGMIDIANNQQLIDSLTTIFYTDTTMTTLDTVIGKPFPIDYDLAVDWRGNPHIVCTFFNMYKGALYSTDSLGYLSPGLAKSIWDITTTDFGGSWNFTYLRELNTFRGSSGDLGWSAGCQAATNYSGDAFVYAWVDDTSANSSDAMQPDLWTFHYDMHSAINLSNIKDWTSDDPSWNGKIILPTMAPFLLQTGPQTYEAPTAFCKILTDAASPVENWFIKDPNYKFTFSTTTYRAAESDILSMNVYPNPSNGNFQVALDLKGTGNVDIRIYDVIGKEVYQVSENGVSSFVKDINIGNLPAGVYVVKAQTTQGAVETKIVKQ